MTITRPCSFNAREIAEKAISGVLFDYVEELCPGASSQKHREIAATTKCALERDRDLQEVFFRRVVDHIDKHAGGSAYDRWQAIQLVKSKVGPKGK